jgi:hypothetical protein
VLDLRHDAPEISRELNKEGQLPPDYQDEGGGR